jgi:HSP20 family molecular chaperone IbpA
MTLAYVSPFMPESFTTFKPLQLLDREPTSQISSSAYDEDDKEIRYSIDVPGVKAMDMEVTVKEGYLHVSGSRKTSSTDGKTIKKARFARSFLLDQDFVDVSKMKANLSDGVLDVTVPKKPKPNPIKIAITTRSAEEEVQVEKLAEAPKEHQTEESDS